MDTKAKVGLGVGAAVIALGTAVGVGALAANLAGGSESSAQATTGTKDAGRSDGSRRGGVNTTELAAKLAEKLGVDEDAVAAALKEVMAATRPSGAPSGQPSTQPSGQPSARPSAGGGRTAMLTTMAKGLAEKLDLDEATVLAALQEVWTSPGQGGGQPSSGQPSAEPTR